MTNTLREKWDKKEDELKKKSKLSIKSREGRQNKPTFQDWLFMPENNGVKIFNKFKERKCEAWISIQTNFKV